MVVFADKDMEEKVMQAGADVFGAICKRQMRFRQDYLYIRTDAGTETTCKGSRSQGPNVKLEVKQDELLDAVKLSKQGQIEFRVNEHADIMVKIGLKEFQDDQLFTNFDAFSKALVQKMPDVIKGKYFVNNHGSSHQVRPLGLSKNDLGMNVMNKSYLFNIYC